MTSHQEDAEPPPNVEGTPKRQTHFWLSDADLDIFDRWEYQLRRGGWRAANRSSCARAMLAVLAPVDVDLAGITSEEELISRIRAALAATLC